MAKVLIVDDTDILRKAMEIAVRKMGHEAHSTASGREALEYAEEQTPDLALLDYRMPEMDGVQLYSALRSALGERCPKVLFVSATPADDFRDALRPPGLEPVGFVQKPFHLDDLNRMVCLALGTPTH